MLLASGADGAPAATSSPAATFGVVLAAIVALLLLAAVVAVWLPTHLRALLPPPLRDALATHLSWRGYGGVTHVVAHSDAEDEDDDTQRA